MQSARAISAWPRSSAFIHTQFTSMLPIPHNGMPAAGAELRILTIADFEDFFVSGIGDYANLCATNGEYTGHEDPLVRCR